MQDMCRLVGEFAVDETTVSGIDSSATA